MRYHRIGDYDLVTRIIGPEHHFLGLRLTRDGEPSGVRVEAVSSTGDVEPSSDRAASQRVVGEVAEGLRNVNARQDIDHRLLRIRYYPSDPIVEGIYTFLTEQLIENLPRAKHTAANPSL